MLENKISDIILNKGIKGKKLSISQKTRMLFCGAIFIILLGCKGEVKAIEEDVYVIGVEERCEIEAEIESQIDNLGFIGLIVGGKTDLGMFLKEKYGEKKYIKIRGNRFTLSNGDVIESVAFFQKGKPYKISELKKSKIVKYIKK